MGYDVIVIGGGHAGCEAALAAARVGARTLLLSINLDHIAQMSCNPAIGGIAKGHVAREVDALGGAMGRVADAATIQFRMLNSKKGPAVWSPRSQCDKVCYQRAMKRELELQPGLHIHQAEALWFKSAKGRIISVRTNFGDDFSAGAFVVTTGTFLSGLLHYGPCSFSGGRAGDPGSYKLARCLAGKLGLRLGRLKTGTPPRILASTLDFTKMALQPAESPDEMFSFWDEPSPLPRADRKDFPCYLVKSTLRTAEIVKDNIHKSPLYAGKISGIGTRYCPSFEDKVVRFPHNETHQLYLEPEGQFTEEYYVNGISTSLPVDVQVQMIRSIPGMESAAISRYAYAIEYDFVFPDQLDRSLGVKRWGNLFLAGQINGTSGYEEAAGQGVVAGLNAARQCASLPPVELGRDQAYIGVMIDDLVTKEIKEPYRLFTSRAEYRLRLRQDNADMRLSGLAAGLGLLTPERAAKFAEYRVRLDKASVLAATVRHDGMLVVELLRRLGSDAPDSELPFPPGLLGLDLDDRLDRKVLREIRVNSHYKGYLEREDVAVARLQRLEDWKIPHDFGYDSLPGLKNESRIKLNTVRPTTLAQAGRIDGITPAEIGLLQVHLKRASALSGETACASDRPGIRTKRACRP